MTSLVNSKSVDYFVHVFKKCKEGRETLQAHGRVQNFIDASAARDAIIRSTFQLIWFSACGFFRFSDSQPLQLPFHVSFRKGNFRTAANRDHNKCCQTVGGFSHGISHSLLQVFHIPPLGTPFPPHKLPTSRYFQCARASTFLYIVLWESNTRA